MKDILILDSTLRDGQHAVKHQISPNQVEVYSSAAQAANIPVVIVGHGNGLGGSSLQVGQSLMKDIDMIKTAKKHLTTSTLGVFLMPGFGTIKKDLAPALDEGVKFVCVGSHYTETDITQRHIKYAKERGAKAYGVLLMSHRGSKEDLIRLCLQTQSYGADGVILMDSAGAFLPQDVTEKVSALVQALDIEVGFHAHNNLGMAVANSIAAVKAGGTILDCCARGFGAGAGNAQLEVVVAVLHKLGYNTGIDLYKVLEAADVAENTLMKNVPFVNSDNIASGLAGIFSGFIPHVKRVAKQYSVDPKDIIFEMGKRNVVAGQEDVIIEIAINLSKKK